MFAGSVDIGVSTGVMGALSGYAKGAPVRIIGNEIMGAGDLYWYVKADSPIKTIQDFNGKTIAFSTVGSSTHGVVTAFVKQYGLTTAKLAATGSPAADLDGGDVRPGRCRLGGAAVRSRPARPRAKSARSPPATTPCSRDRRCAS